MRKMTAHEAAQVGLNEVARISSEMDAILRSKGLKEGSIGERVQQLSKDPAQQYPNTPEGKQAMIAQYQVILDEANAALGDTFNVRPKLGVQVKPVPEFAQATSPGAYYQPGSFDGARPGVFYANMRMPAETPTFPIRTSLYLNEIPTP